MWVEEEVRFLQGKGWVSNNNKLGGEGGGGGGMGVDGKMVEAGRRVVRKNGTVRIRNWWEWR